jgi:dTDP-4-amino-4,6-dideoxy-D-galactose acyltransferase
MRIARVTANRLTGEEAERVMEWCGFNAIECLYFLCDPDDPESTKEAEEGGFHLVDIKVTLESNLSGAPAAAKGRGQGIVRPFMPADIPTLRAIAKTGHRDSRFYYDKNFPRPLCDDFYETWIENSCTKEYADAVLVAELESKPAGYVTCKLLDQASGQIGLLGVYAKFRGMGIGVRLVVDSLRWFSEHGIRKVKVVTQGRNVKAQRLYQRCGFLTSSVKPYYHRWFEKS